MRSKGKGNQIFMADRDPRTRRPAQVTLMARKSAPVSAGGINARRLERWRLAAMAAEREEEEDDDYVDEEEEDEEDEEESDDDEDDDEEEEKEEEEKEPNNQCGNPFCRQILANRYARYCEDKPLCQRYRALKLQCLANAQAEEEEEDTRPLALVIKKKKKKKEEKEKKKEEEPFAIPRRKKTEIGGKRRLNLNATAAPIEGKSRSNSNSPREMVKKRQKKRDMDKRLEEEKEKEEKKQRKKLKRAREAAGSKGTTSVSVTSNSPSVQGSSVSSEEEFVSLADELKTRVRLRDPRTRPPPDASIEAEARAGLKKRRLSRHVSADDVLSRSASSSPGQWEGRSYPPPRDHYPPRQQEPSSFGASNGRDGGSFDYAMDTHFSPASSPPDQSYRRENQREDPPLPLRAPSPRRSEPERVNGDRRTSDFDDLDEDAPTFSYNEVFLPQLLSIFIHKFPSALDAISNVTKKPRKMNWYIKYVERIQRLCQPHDVLVKLEGTKAVVTVRGQIGSGSHEDKREAFRLATVSALDFLLSAGRGTRRRSRPSEVKRERSSEATQPNERRQHRSSSRESYTGTTAPPNSEPAGEASAEASTASGPSSSTASTPAPVDSSASGGQPTVLNSTSSTKPQSEVSTTEPPSTAEQAIAPTERQSEPSSSPVTVEHTEEEPAVSVIPTTDSVSSSEVADAAEQSDPGEEMSISDASDPGAITPAGSPLLPTTHASSSVPLATPGSDVTVPDSTVAGSSATTSSVAFSSTTTESSVAPLPSSVPSGIAAMVAKFAAAAGVSTAPNSQSTAKTTVPARRCMMCEMIRMRKPDGERCLRCQQKDAPANGLLGSSLDP
ncbi:hypothetical protein PF005_g20583 [Phytophthora fragariae]|uniref:Uncharacterized protein n=1 Tax=Phytophthora fragariae TaxID=53985 RepID=A0A6A3WLK7_9STRA|nr:hypothetical protein PF005_g20583 [Phytophthora fragariae]KAE9219979.1 hypothetical protein PF004_g13468 [Phytophthora fragariae]